MHMSFYHEFAFAQIGDSLDQVQFEIPQRNAICGLINANMEPGYFV